MSELVVTVSYLNPADEAMLIILGKHNVGTLSHDHTHASKHASAVGHGHRASGMSMSLRGKRSAF